MSVCIYISKGRVIRTEISQEDYKYELGTVLSITDNDYKVVDVSVSTNYEYCTVVTTVYLSEV